MQRPDARNDRTNEHGPFDIVGDVHGCYGELLTLLGRLGYDVEGESDDLRIHHAQGRKLVFVGDLVDRGPNSPDVLRLVMSVVNNRTGYCVCGNHDAKLLRALKGAHVQRIHGLDITMEQLAHERPDFLQRVIAFLSWLPSHYLFDGGRLVVAHAGLKEHMQGVESSEVRAFTLYGETTGITDEYGYPERYLWANDYRGAAMVVYGHTPVATPQWVNHTMDIDTGCVFGGALTALRYPEGVVVQVPAADTYALPKRPLA